MTVSEILPSPKGIGVRNLYKKVIILFTIFLFSLTTIFSPTKVYQSIGIFIPNNINRYTYISDENTKIEEKLVKRVVNNYIKKLEKQGYENVSYEQSAFLKILNKYQIQTPSKLIKNNFYNLENGIIHTYDYYAEYNTIKIDDTIYYFKNLKDLESFKEKIIKYDNKDYDINIIKDSLGKETSEDILNKVISQKEKEYKKKLAIKEKEEQQKNIKIQDLSGVAYDNPIVNYAIQFNGNPYVYGGTSLTNGADCSGFVQSIYKHFGINLPRRASIQASSGKSVKYSDIQPGDLIFYSGNGGKSVTHVAIYIGGGKIIHAQTPSRGIGITTANMMVIMSIRRVI